MSLSFVAFVACSEDKDNPVNNENTRTESSNGGNGSSNDNGSQSGNIPENNSSVLYYSGKERGHSYVDLGLPSGTLWATCNVGAAAPQDYGYYYAWGEVEPQANKEYSWVSYKYGNSSSLIKYNSDARYGKDGFVDNKATLDIEDDAANVNWGGKWRMPTRIQQDELLGQCYWEWTDSYNNTNVAGKIVYKAKTGADKGKHSGTPSSSYSLSDAHVFLPAAGRYYKGVFEKAGYMGFCWSSSSYDDVYIAERVRNFNYSSDYAGDGFSGPRCAGISVRAVISGE